MTSSSPGSSATLAASLIGGRYINKKPGFNGGWASGQVPTDWQDWGFGWSNTRVPGLITEGAVRWVVPADTDYGLRAAFVDGKLKYRPTPGWWVVDFTFTLDSGSLQGSGGILTMVNEANTAENQPRLEINFFAECGAGVVGKTYSVSKLVHVLPGVGDFGIYVMPAWSVFGARPAKTITYHFAGVRPAEAGEVETGVARNGYSSISARMTNEEMVRASETAALSVRQGVLAATTRDLAARTQASEGALVTVQGRQTAWAQRRVIAGSAEAFAEMMALDDNGDVTSDINFGAKALGFWNSVSALFVKVMEIVGGSVFITGKLFMGLAKQITLDPTIPALIFTPHSGVSKMIYGAGFGSSSDCLMWLGPKDTDISDITRINGGWAFGTDGKAYFGNAELSTGGGFRASSNVLSVSGDRVGAGTVTTDAVTISATGGGAPITYAWTQVSGDFGAWTILSPSSASTQFRTVVSTPGTGRLASFACRLTDASGRVDTVIVPATVVAEVDGGGGA